MNGRVVVISFLLAGCAEIKTPQPVSLPSICMGEQTCEARKNAETLSKMGYPDAGLVIMCSDSIVREALEDECGDELLFQSVY